MVEHRFALQVGAYNRVTPQLQGWCILCRDSTPDHAPAPHRGDQLPINTVSLGVLVMDRMLFCSEDLFLQMERAVARLFTFDIAMWTVAHGY